MNSDKEKEKNAHIIKAGKFSINSYILFPALVFLSGMFLFLLIRLILFFVHRDLAVNIPFQNISTALFKTGSIFDSAINSYLLVLPVFFLSLGYFIRPARSIFFRLSVISICVLYLTALSLSLTDIPFFGYYNSRLTNSVLNWSDDMALMIKTGFSSSTYYPYVALFIIFSVLFCRWIYILARKTIFIRRDKENNIFIKILYFIILVFLLFNGMRGNLEYNKFPLRVADAFNSEYSFANQLGLNPVFTFFNSYIDTKPALISDKEAVTNVQKYLNIRQEFDSPIARKVSFDSASTKPNVVVFIVESLGAWQLKRYGRPVNIMPFFDSLMNQSAAFDNIYTAGMHTNNGVYSSLFAMPSVYNNKPFSSPLANGQKFSGIPNTLYKNGYSTIFFCTGNKNFDNMNSFLSRNDFETIISQDDYPKDSEFTEWGVHDGVMFRFAIEKLNQLSGKGKPFFASLLTISTHESIPLPKSEEKNFDAEIYYDKQYQYLDKSFSDFFKSASDKNWFANTIFVIVADHGQNFDPTYDVPLSYFHTPLVFYSPALIKPAAYDCIGLQIDLFPTLMGFAGLPYVNNTLGIDLRKEKRQFAYFTSDEKFGCLNEDYYMIIRNDETDGIYKYRNKDIKNYIKEQKSLADSMRVYTYSMMQTADWLTEHKLLSIP